jgi:hypothetical protein
MTTDCLGCGLPKKCGYECCWCESPFCQECLDSNNECEKRNSYVVCKDCNEVPLDGRID